MSEKEKTLDLTIDDFIKVSGEMSMEEYVLFMELPGPERCKKARTILKRLKKKDEKK